MAKKPRSALNKYQRKAVRYGTKKGRVVHKKPLVIVAGAGTGKTMTLASRVAWLLKCGADPQKMVLITFTNRAASELKDRVAEYSRTSTAELGYAGTFHGWAARLLQEFAGKIGLQKTFTILDAASSVSLLHKLRQLHDDQEILPSAADCRDIFSYQANSLSPLEQVLNKRFPDFRGSYKALGGLLKEYTREKREQALLDFDDLLTGMLALLNRTGAAKRLQERVSDIFVDEYQDCSVLQVEILRKLKPDGSGLTVVGDDDQAIYSFRGAAAQNLEWFSALFKKRPQRVVLTRNYRSTQPILQVLNAVMLGTPGERRRRQLWSKKKIGSKPILTRPRDAVAQARYVVDRVIKAQANGILLHNQAILYRTTIEAFPVEQELMRRGVPYTKSGGSAFLEKKHVKDVLSILVWSTNPCNRVAACRTLMLIPGVGPRTAETISKLVARRGCFRILAAKKSIAQAGVRRLSKLLRSLRGAANWQSGLKDIISWYQVAASGSDERSKARDLRWLLQLASEFRTRDAMLTALIADAVEVSDPDLSKEKDGLVLSTIHSAKGQEWPSVFIINAVDGCIPNFRAADVKEEGRVLHVALTRAQSFLEVLAPRRLVSSNEEGNSYRVLNKITQFFPDPIWQHFQHET